MVFYIIADYLGIGRRVPASASTDGKGLGVHFNMRHIVNVCPAW